LSFISDTVFPKPGHTALVFGDGRRQAAGGGWLDFGDSMAELLHELKVQPGQEADKEKEGGEEDVLPGGDVRRGPASSPPAVDRSVHCLNGLEIN
ncbi:hypothetical protein THAOC_27018, partial [Thalassiosira oceanica]